MSAATETPPSGDFLFDRFTSETPKVLNSVSGYYNPILSSNFGITYTDALSTVYDYDYENKIMNIYGKHEDTAYISYIGSKISENYIEQIISLKNTNEQYPIEITYKRGLNNEFELDDELNETILKNVNMWKYKNENIPLFLIEQKIYRNRLKLIHDIFGLNWENINIEQDEYNEKLYHLQIPDNLILSLRNEHQVNTDQIIKLYERGSFANNEAEYVILSNEILYFVLKIVNDEIDIYDWNIIAIPKFCVYHAPIFNVTFENRSFNLRFCS